jgi:DNA topoisomerase-1
MVIEPKNLTRDAGLVYVSDDRPGISRRRHGKGFSYRRPDGELVRDPEVRRRIDALAIPPAYRDVWISADPRGHLQATGRDERGRKQYIYHPRWHDLRGQHKFDRLLVFAEVLPRIRRRVGSDLRLEGLQREKVLAAVVRLLESTLVRVGNASYARENGSFGLTTIRKKHVALEEDTVVFEFQGKGGQEWRVESDDERITEVVRQCVEIPGYELFKYIDDDGTKRDVESGDVNDYLRGVTNEEITAKDFRTWAGTVLCAETLAGRVHTNEREAKKNVGAAVREVSGSLGNTPSVCRQSYIHPVIIDSYLAGVLTERLSRALENGVTPPRGLRGVEAGVWRLLREQSGGR